MTAGAVAAGSRYSVDAGLRALSLGGNAIDAAVAAALMACVAEPTLTGLGGAGLATARVGGQVWVCDMFGAVPGCEAFERPPGEGVDVVELDYGAATQAFHVGPGTVAVPGLPAGLHALHARWGRLSLEALAAPAAARAREGVEISFGLQMVFDLLWPILHTSPDLVALFGREDGGYKHAGERFSYPELGAAIERFAAEGPGFFYEGEGAAAMVRTLGDRARLGLEDLRAYRPRFMRPMRAEYLGAEIWTPGPPSVGGLMMLGMLGALADGGPLPNDAGAAEVVRLALAMDRTFARRTPALWQDFFTPDLPRTFLAAGRTGFTTHVSAVDAEGNAIGITSSLGESAGLYVPETGVLLNNLLGEEDVNPPDAHLGVGERLITMCSPTLIVRGDRVDVLGTGGSSRIPTAVLHGVHYLVGCGLRPDEVIRQPRAHMEGGDLRVESGGRPPGTLGALQRVFPGVGWVEAPSLYFGGLNIASLGPDGFAGAGDHRRFGSFGVAP